ncbi:hypothetical protein IAU60_004999 [Kwoniella sp. DSM 27419]
MSLVKTEPLGEAQAPARPVTTGSPARSACPTAQPDPTGMSRSSSALSITESLTASIGASADLSDSDGHGAERDREQPEAGPSTPRTLLNQASVVVTPGSGASSDPRGKGKGKAGAPERRVLPARIRRSTGGGEGMRDVEEMIVDWLERWGEPQLTPPDDLPIHLTSIPLASVQPPTRSSYLAGPEAPSITLTPTRTKSEVDQSDGKIGQEEKIEVPSWVMVRAGEDDQEEAREELEQGSSGHGNSKRAVGKGPVSPVKRLRRGHIGDEPSEDTSDAYYIQLHRKYEAFERRQRIREKEKLQFEKYKMRSRIDLLRNMPKMTWSSVVSTIIARGPDEWAKGKDKVMDKGADWLKGRLIKEGEEVMARYEELLPPEQRKPKPQTPQQVESRPSTPSRASSSPSLTPPPAVIPARVAALRDPPSSSAKRKRRLTVHMADTPTKTEPTVAGERRSPRVVRTYGKRGQSDVGLVKVELDDSGELVKPVPSADQASAATAAKTPSGTSKRPLRPAPVSAAAAPVIQPKIEVVQSSVMPIPRLVPVAKPTPIAPQASPAATLPPQPPQPPQLTLPTPPIQPTQPPQHQSTPPQPTAAKAKPDRPLYPIFNRPILPAPSAVPPTSITPASAVTSKTNPAPTPAKPRMARPVLAPATVPRTPIRPVPALIQAATRREVATPVKTGVHAVQNGLSPSVGTAQVPGAIPMIPFGVPLPGVVERRSDFTLVDVEDFWPLIAQREERARKRKLDEAQGAVTDSEARLRHTGPNAQSLGFGNGADMGGVAHASGVKLMTAEVDGIMTPEEVAELEGVEEAVVL